jgi:hypothetical protein
MQLVGVTFGHWWRIIMLRKAVDGSFFAPRRGTPPACPEGFVRDRRDPFRFYIIRGKGDTYKKFIDQFWKICFGGCAKRQKWLNEKFPAPSQELYQILYEDPALRYGDSEADRCPGTRYFPRYSHWLKGRIIDLGCGRGDTVHMMREAGFFAHGIDQVDLDNDMIVGSILDPINMSPYDTATCLDVFEHLHDEELLKLVENMKQAERQVITVHMGESQEAGYPVELHVNIKTKDEWWDFLTQHFTIRNQIVLGADRLVYLTERKQ